MSTTLLIIIAVLGIFFGMWLGRRRRLPPGVARGARGGVGAAQERSAQKEKNVGELRKYIQEKGTITNDEVEELLGVSNATAERYLDELEKDGLLEQMGETGRSVHYRLRP